MNHDHPSIHVAVIGAGLAGAACASGLQRAGYQVEVFDKSRGVGGRMSTRRARWMDADGTGLQVEAEFDHGAQHFGAVHPRFRAWLARVEKAGVVASWQPRVHAAWPAPLVRRCHVAVPGMPALSRHALGDIPVHLGAAVQRLHRDGAGWHLVLADGTQAGPFQQVVLALPPAQAAVLLAGHHDDWADALAAVHMQPCWTLMAVTDELDWPWDAAEPTRGPLAWVVRNDRKPGRSAPAGCATWVAQATAAWSAAYLEADPRDAATMLQHALAAQLPAQTAVRWHHVAVHRWRYAAPADPAPDERECWWDGLHGIGVCGDYLAGGTVEAAWRSGDELADTLAAALEPGTAPEQPGWISPSLGQAPPVLPSRVEVADTLAKRS